VGGVFGKTAASSSASKAELDLGQDRPTRHFSIAPAGSPALAFAAC
jgi:hypothetical protein